MSLCMSDCSLSICLLLQLSHNPLNSATAVALLMAAIQNEETNLTVLDMSVRTEVPAYQHTDTFTTHYNAIGSEDKVVAIVGYPSV